MGKSLKDVSNDHGAKKPRYQPTIPQNIMRADMERGAHRDDVEEAEPKLMSLGAVFDDVVGPQEAPVNTLSRYGAQQERAPQIVYDIIDQYDLVLSLKQWHVVQKMMEQAVMTGVQLELDMRHQEKSALFRG